MDSSESNQTPQVHQSPSSSPSMGGKPRPTFKVIVIGDSGVGKTCLTYKFCAGHFPSSGTEATIGVDFREKIVSLNDGEEVRIQFWDTAGQERFRRSMVTHYYRNVNAVVFVYDVSSKTSFEAMPHWIAECDLHGLMGKVPMLMVGNKCEDGVPKMVPFNEAQRLADENNMPVFETSAKADSQSDHVEAIFLTLAHKIKNARPLLSSVESTDEGINVGGGRGGQSIKRVVYRNEAYESQNQGCCL